MRYFFHIAYKGTQYRGWQRQPNAISVQEVLENEINRILKLNTYIVGCGRTDAEVHASQFFFHLDVKKEWDFDLKFRLNKALPPDIAIYDIIPVADRANARFDAIQRTYDYFIHTEKRPFLCQTSACYQADMDVERMRRAAHLLMKYQDYKAFCKTPDKHNTTICNIMNTDLFVKNEGKQIQFQITANRFLRGMIRIIVARLIAVGKGNISLEEFEGYLSATKTPKFTNFAYPQGLYLSKVVYPYLDLPKTGLMDK